MKRKKIVIADDEYFIRLLVKKLLGAKYIVIEAGDGEEAINITRMEQPDLVLMDIMMPKLDGYTACGQIKRDEATREIPVIMLTGAGHELIKKLALQIGADAYMTKPFDLERLRGEVDTLLGIAA